MSHIQIVPTDLRRYLPKSRSCPSPVPPVEWEASNEEPPAPLSFSELQVLLERQRPLDLAGTMNRACTNPSDVAYQLSRQKFHHNERLNYVGSVQGTLASEAVYLSAQAVG